MSKGTLGNILYCTTEYIAPRVNELKEDVSELRKEIAELKDLLNKLLEEKENGTE